MTVIAKGCRKVRSRRPGCFEVFTESNFHLNRRNGEIFLVTSVSILQGFEFTELNVLRKIYLTTEWLLALLPSEKEAPNIYQLFVDYLSLINKQNKIYLLNTAFKIKLLNQLGFLPGLESFRESERKVLKFFLLSSFLKIIRLEEDRKVLAKINQEAENIFRRETEKISKVELITSDWE